MTVRLSLTRHRCFISLVVKAPTKLPGKASAHTHSVREIATNAVHLPKEKKKKSLSTLLSQRDSNIFSYLKGVDPRYSEKALHFYAAENNV